ncbi:type VI secretion system-associated protein TagO [Paraburkholderia tropica]|uniref:type VI secretion system-associated protein TagO n=1 Tax=Paraburkholderia tropica TaxID=92647 RepID=UPI002AAF9E66|nr:type VI secretion system-associated protein TagO [Paraburkholderia tropica]
MRLTGLSGLLAALLFIAGCHPRQENPAAATNPIAACTVIVSPMQRLACFDAVAGTPAGLARLTAEPATAGSPSIAASAAAEVQSESAPAVAELVRRNEASRTGDSSQFVMSRWPDGDQGRLQVVISAPAIGSGAQGPWLAISCKSGITRLQFLSSESLLDNRIRIRLSMDGRSLSDATIWQVLESGNVIDAGRGLVAIELLRRIGNGARLRIESSYPALDGQEFDATRLKALIDEEREACHW